MRREDARREGRRAPGGQSRPHLADHLELGLLLLVLRRLELLATDQVRVALSERQLQNALELRLLVLFGRLRRGRLRRAGVSDLRRKGCCSTRVRASWLRGSGSARWLAPSL